MECGEYHEYWAYREYAEWREYAEYGECMRYRESSEYDGPINGYMDGIYNVGNISEMSKTLPVQEI